MPLLAGPRPTSHLGAGLLLASWDLGGKVPTSQRAPCVPVASAYPILVMSEVSGRGRSQNWLMKGSFLQMQSLAPASEPWVVMAPVSLASCLSPLGTGTVVTGGIWWGQCVVPAPQGYGQLLP